MRSVSEAKRSLVLILLFISTCYQGQAQDKHLTNPTPDQMAFVDMNENKGTFFLSANRLNTNKSNIDQQNLFRKSWLRGVVQFATGKQYNDGLLQFDLANNQLYFNKDGRPNIFAEAVNGFTLSDTTNGTMEVARFNNGYPAFGKQTPATFYQVLAYGKKVHLLKHTSKYVVEKQGYNTMTTFEYKLIEDYFVYNALTGELKLLKRSPASFTKVLPEYEKVLNKLNLSKKLTEANLTEAVNAINQL